MNGRLVIIFTALLAVALFCGCVGYFHYHPIKSTDEEAAGSAGGKVFTNETSMGAAVTPAISAAPVSEESLIK